VEQEVEELIS